MTLSAYSQLKNCIVLAVVRSERHSEILSSLKEMFRDHINSIRRFEQISTIGQLLNVLEIRDILSEDNVQCLKNIASKLVNSKELLKKITEYEACYVPRESMNYYGAEEIYNSLWFAHNKNKNKPGDGSDSINVEPSQDSTNENVQEHSNSEGSPSQRELSDSGEQSSQRESFNSNKVQRERNIRKQETDDNMMMRSAFDILQKSANSLNTMNDEFGTFGMFVANKLRKYTENTKNHVQHMISNILYSADIGKFDYYDTNMYGGSRGYRTAHRTPSNASTSAVAQNPNQQDTNNMEASLADLDLMSPLLIT